jgi:hypothetical protein
VIRLVIRFIQWILILLCHTACNGCRSYEISSEEDRWGAAIAIKPTSSNGVNLLGSINGIPALELSGTISKNVPGVGTAYLCALFVPDGEAPDASAEEIRSCTVKADSHSTSSGTFDLDKLHQLPSGSFVQYARPLKPDEVGDVKFVVAAYGSENSLALGTTYKIYLGIKVGPHFFYTVSAHADYTLPDASTHTQVAMTSTSCVRGRNLSSEIIPELSAAADVTNSPSSGSAGFLFIKQGGSLTPTKVFAGQLAPGSAPLSKTLNTLTAHPDSEVVCTAATIAAPSFTIASVRDTNNALELGATYDVYGYIEDGPNYYVSQNSCSITLPKVEIDVTMLTVGDPQLLATKGSLANDVYDVSNFVLPLTGRITKTENATDPVAGFVFVAASQSPRSKEEICKAIAGNVGSNPSAGTVIDVDGNKDYVVCIAETKNVDAVQDISYTFDLSSTGGRPELGRKYLVYFWVRDARGCGEIFLSDNGLDPEVFYTDGNSITGLRIDRVGDILTITPTMTSSSITNAHNAAKHQLGIFFSEKGNITAQLRDLYNSHVNSNLPVVSNGWSHTNAIFGNRLNIQSGAYYAFPTAGSVREISARNGVDLKAGTTYFSSLVVLKGKVFYNITSTFTFKTPEPLKEKKMIEVKITPIRNVEKIYLALDEHYACLIPAVGNHRRLDPTVVDEKNLIIAAINAYASEPNANARMRSEFEVGS